GGSLPSGIQSVCVTILANRTSETGVENTFTNDLIYEFTRNGKIAGIDKADALLSGVVKSMSIETISHRGVHTSLERRVRFTLDLKLTDNDGRTIWSKSVSENEAYDVATDNKLTTEQNRSKAISTLSTRLAEKVYNSLTEDF
ncbi:MAG: LPS assembly lipoprotein LptE, partial [Thermodesulfobacteriota bacterium]|nr:LPS assembly lipoprotein LptE [Thermodesulfobacteriota bacterium]